jgi:hypothetical protein
LTEKTQREACLRRVVAKQGYRLEKSPARDPRDRTYGGFQIVNPGTVIPVAGCGNTGRGYNLDLDTAEKIGQDVEAYLARLHAATAKLNC